MTVEPLVSSASDTILVTYVKQYGYWRIECPGWGSAIAFCRQHVLEYRASAQRFLGVSKSDALGA